MPEAPPARLTRYSSDGIPELARQLLPLMILDQLQSQGLLEQLQREAFGMAQSTIASLVTARGFIEGGSGKPQGFVSEPGSGKPQGFVSEPGSGKPQGFGPAERVVKAHKAVKGRRGLKRQKPLKLRVLKPVEFTASKQRHKQKEKPAIRIRRPNRHAYESVVKTA